MKKVLNINKPIWLIIFSSIMLGTIGFIVVEFTYDDWFSQTLKSDDFSIDYKGGLLKPQGKSDFYQHFYNECSSDDLIGDGFCKQLKAFRTGGLAYMSLSLFSLLFVTGSYFILMVNICKCKSLKHKFPLIMTSVLYGLGFLLHILGFIIWALVVKVRFHECKYDMPLKIEHDVCWENGAGFAVFVNVFMLIISVANYGFMKKLKNRSGRLISENRSVN